MGRNILRSLFILFLVATCSQTIVAASDEVKPQGVITSDNLSKQNLLRSMQLTDRALSCYFKESDGLTMYRYFNPYTDKQPDEKASVWMYTSAIEAVNSILAALDFYKEQGEVEFYATHAKRYEEWLNKLYQGADYYLGTFELTSYTQTKNWTVYAVDRAREKGAANVTGVLNVYDDQMWLIREFLQSYRLTGDEDYLSKAEYLTEYVLDGWDCTIDKHGKENGGIPWGPGYTTKHACSNAPMLSSLIGLYEIYKDDSATIEHRYIDVSDRETRRVQREKKADYYLAFAKKIYAWQQEHLLTEKGVYDDMMGGCDPNCDIVYEEVKGLKYRTNTPLRTCIGPPYSYNSGTMLSGAAELYRVTGDRRYQEDVRRLSDASFQYFAHLGKTLPDYYSYDVRGFSNWFNLVLLHGFLDVSSIYEPAHAYINTFQQNLDYGYTHFLHKDLLPTNLLAGWLSPKEENKLEGMFMFTYATTYAVLAKYVFDKNQKSNNQ